MSTGKQLHRVIVPESASLIVWCVWIAGGVAASLPALLWHLDYARQGHPASFWLFVAVVMGVPFLGAPVYQVVRRYGLWKREPVIAGGVAMAACLWFSTLGALSTIWLFLGAYCTGRFVMCRLGVQTRSLSTGLVFRFLTGFGVLLWPLTLLGYTGHFNQLAFAVLLLLAVAVSFRGIVDLLRSVSRIAERWAESMVLAHGPVAFAVVVLSVLMLAGLIVALAPSVGYDPLRFHLPLARHYVETGALDPLQSDNYGYNPQGFEMLLTVVYAMSGQMGAQLVSPGFFVLFLAALFSVCRRFGFGRAGSVLATVFAASIPYVHWVGVNVKHDVIVATLQLAALLAWYEWRDCRNFRWIYLGVFLCATALGFKHPAAFGILGLAPLYLWAAWKEPRRLRVFTGCALLIVVLGSFWLVRSYVLTGDAFRYYNFEQPLPGDHAEQVGSLTNRVQTALTWPYQVHFDGGLFFRSFTSNPLGFALLLFAPVWILLRRKMGPEARAALLFAAVSLIPWSFYVPLLRFVIAPICVLMLLTVARLHEWYSTARPLLRWPMRLAAAWAASVSICVILIIEVNAPQLRYLFLNRDREQYLQDALRTYPSLRILNDHAEPGDFILGIDNCSMAYAPDPDIFYCRPRNPDNPADIADLNATLNDRRFRYVVFPTGHGWNEVLLEHAGERPMRSLSTGEYFSVYELE